MSDAEHSVISLARETGFSGVVRIDDPDGTTFERAFGFAHRGFEVPNQTDTQFGIASGAKGFTALVVVSLVEEGLLSLDTTARSILGDDLPLISADVTVGHLLGHTSGIGDYLDEEDETYEFDDYVLQSPIHELEKTDAFLAEIDGYETKFAAGERFSYSNGGFIVLAVIAERVSGVPYHDLVQRRVLDPAGLSDTGFLRSDEASGRMAVGYLYPDGLRSNVLHLPVRGNGDGGIYTTAADMRTFWLALFAGQIVSDGWVKKMTAPISDAPGEDARYGLGFWVAEDGPSVSLIGGDAGVSFSSIHDPTTEWTCTVLSNTTRGAWPIVRALKDSTEP